MSYNYPCLRDYVNDDMTIVGLFSTIFSQIKTASGVIFSSYDSELLSEMGYQYYFERSRFPLKVLYYRYCENSSFVDWSDSTSITAFMTRIAKVAYARFGSNWEKIYNAYFVKTYEPLENYDMEQKRSPLLDTTNTTDRKQDTKVETSGKTKIVPFNETTSTLTGESEGSSDTTELKADNVITSKVEERGSDTITRHGNIGVTTSQQMLQSELDLRKLDFQKIIFRDLDRILFRDYIPVEHFLVI